MKKDDIELFSKKKSLNFIKELRRVLSTEIPSALTPRYTGQMIIGIFMFALGITIIPFGGLAIGLFSMLIGLCIMCSGIMYKAAVLKGYNVIVGTIVGHTKIFPGMKVADGYTLQTKQGKIHIPSTKRKNVLPIGTELKVYISKNSTQYERNNVTNYGNVFGFEVLI